VSHSCKDSVGGHVGSWAGIGDAEVSGMLGRRFAKKWNRREARRETRAVVAAALKDLEEEREEALEMHEANEAFYEMLYEDEYEREQHEIYDEESARWGREQEEDEVGLYDSYYGGYYDDYNDECFYHATESVIDTYSDSGESLGDILARRMVEGAR